jgi:hypothetical protein
VKAFYRVTSAVVIGYLHEMFACWGMPKSVISDNGPQFVSYEFDEFLRHQGIQSNKTSLYHPHSNGGVDRFNDVLKQGLRAQLLEAFAIQDAIYIESPHHIAHPFVLLLDVSTPMELMIGRPLRTSLSVLQPADVAVSGSSKTTSDLASENQQ